MPACLPIRTLIADDEPLARENLRIRLAAYSDFAIVAEAGCGRDTVASIVEATPDLVFLDVKMPDMNGFEVLERVPAEVMPLVVFVTAYDRFALEAFRVHALDYLLKPVAEDRFAEMLHTCRHRVAEIRGAASHADAEYHLSVPPAHSASPGALDRLIVKGNGRVIFLKLSSVRSIEAYGDYIRVHVDDKSYLLRRTMNDIEARLDPKVFARISRSSIVNLEHVRQLESLSRGEYRVLLSGDKRLKLTRTYRDRLERLLGDCL